MYRFQHPYFLLLLLIMPICVYVFYRFQKWQKIQFRKLGDAHLVQSQVLGAHPKSKLRKFILLMAAFLFLVLGLANFQTGDASSIVTRHGVDVIFALDVSKSMLATDVKPSRLEKAKQFIELVMDKMNGNRVGLVLFAGKAYLQVPLTVDFDATQMMLENAQPDVVPFPGTVLGDAIKLSDHSFSQKEKKYKAIVLISDGEDHDETALSAVKDAVKNGAVVHTIGLGSPDGTTFIDPATGKVKVDEDGKPVVTKLNEQELKSLATAGNGSYQLLVNSQQASNNLLNQLSKMESKSLGAVVFDDYNSYYQYFFAVAALCLLGTILIPDGKKIILKEQIA